MIQIVLKNAVNVTLKRCRDIAEFKRHNQILELIISCVECDQSFVFFFDLNSVERMNHV